jgi:hypothetical protein
MIFANPANDSQSGMVAWAKRLIQDINRHHPPASRWPTFANDAAAAAGNLKVGYPYVTPTGEMRRRVV